MPRQRILTVDAQQAFDTPPTLSLAERQKYFSVSPALSERLASLRTPTNQVGFLLQLGYFRATYRFFSTPYPAHDVADVAGRLDIPPATVAMSSYDEATSRRHRQLILEYLGYHRFDEHARQRVTEHLRPLIRSQVRPKILFQETITFLKNHRIEIPGSGTLTLLIVDTVRQHQQELVERVHTALSIESRMALDALFEKAPGAAEDLQVQRARLTLLKRFSHSMRPAKLNYSPSKDGGLAGGGINPRLKRLAAD